MTTTLRHWNRLNLEITRCQACTRLREYCAEVGQKKRRAYQHETYWAQPVPNFGDPQARLLVVGLAPAAHGANRTGRMFTGDRSGDWLYRALHRAGFSSQPQASSQQDGLQLIDCAITAICHCAPPGNKPTRDEQQNCQTWLTETLQLIPAQVYLTLGRIAWDGLWRTVREQEGWKLRRPEFRHGAEVKLPHGHWLVGCYHPSQQNTFTGRLTESMLDAVIGQAKAHLRPHPR